MGKEHATDRQSHRDSGMENTTLQHARPDTRGTSPASPGSYTSTGASTSSTSSSTSSTGTIDQGPSSPDAMTRPSTIDQDAPITGTSTIRSTSREVKTSPNHHLGTKGSGKPEAPIAQAQPDSSSLTQKLWTAGWNTFGRLLPGGAKDDPADLNNINAVPLISEGSSDSEDILSFFERLDLNPVMDTPLINQTLAHLLHSRTNETTKSGIRKLSSTRWDGMPRT